MSQNFLPLTVLVHILGARESDTVYAERRALIPFIPISGVTLRLWNEGEEALDISMEGVVFDVRDSTFKIEVQDEDARAAWYSGKELSVKDILDWYVTFGFKRSY